MGMHNTKVTFIAHPVVEFICGLDFLANENKYNQLFQEYHYEQDEAVKAKVQLMAGKVSRFLAKEIDYFFKMPEIIDVLGRLIIENPQLEQVNDYIQYLEKLNVKTLLVYILERFYFDDPVQAETILKLINNRDQYESVFSNVTRSGTTSEIACEKLLDIIESPEEIKFRLTLLLRQFYEKCYAPIEAEIMAILITEKEKFEKLFQGDRVSFYKEFLREQAVREVKDFIVNISYFVQIGRWKFLIMPQNNIEYISIGMYADQYSQSSFQKIKVKKLLKLLADEKRFEMIQLLAQKTWYGHELAEALGITPPTVSYHINAMLELGLIFLEKDSNKTYYHLDKEKLRQMLQLVEVSLLSEK
ncbi:winged helix-turn-helix transcriptional regulator [Fusibacter paucivorans]|uniref:Winged helix-turn-helix transcriptional regulator n=1 Tax=Fusibacter paucivorans TaxID=76009 RepID=A0ABS5PTJ1_9FIRM|nr:winged helix-turn-helix domain-containing protein [Fusibacter paucivorans]MBS7528489.1 winged helix-turn-helix transcriptional regulator [Fusibacter paucivorans]